jgi:hypothetical protein
MNSGMFSIHTFPQEQCQLYSMKANGQLSCLQHNSISHQHPHSLRSTLLALTCIFQRKYIYKYRTTITLLKSGIAIYAWWNQKNVDDHEQINYLHWCNSILRPHPHEILLKSWSTWSIEKVPNSQQYDVIKGCLAKYDQVKSSIFNELHSCIQEFFTVFE